jgi:hypothetical protein
VNGPDFTPDLDHTEDGVDTATCHRGELKIHDHDGLIPEGVKGDEGGC